MKRTARLLGMLLALLMLASTFTAFAQDDLGTAAGEYYTVADPGAKVNGNVTVFEFKLPKYTGEIDGDVYAAFSLVQNAGGVEYVLDLISVDTAAGKILVGSDGQTYELVNKNGYAIKVKDTPVSVAVVYDDINGTARYFINNVLAYILVNGVVTTPADRVVFDPDFAGREYVSYTRCRLFAGEAEAAIAESAYEFGAYNIDKGDTARLIGFQQSDEGNQLRLVAGVETMLYENIGFEIETFIGGASKGVAGMSKNTVFGSVTAGDKVITAESMGYAYFAAAEISALPNPILENSYLIVRSYIEIAGVKHYDDAVKISVYTDVKGNLRYFFDDEGFIYTNDFDGLTKVPEEWEYKFGDIADGSAVSLTDSGKLKVYEPKHNGGTYLFLNQYIGKNYVVQADVTITEKYADNSYMSLLFGYKNTGAYGEAFIRFNGEASISEKNIGKYEGTSVTAADTGFSFELNKTYTLTMVCYGNKVAFFIDGIIITEGECATTARDNTGKVGFLFKGLTTEIDNFIVRTTDSLVDDVIFTEDFEDAEKVSKEWIEVSNSGSVKNFADSTTMSVANGKLVHKNSGNYMISLLDKELPTGDYIVQGDFKVTRGTNTSGYFGLVFRYSATQKFIDAALRIRGDGWIEAQTPSSWASIKSLGDASKPVFKESNEEESYVYTLTAICKGKEISFYINGTLIGTGNIDNANKTLGEEYLTGKVGFYTRDVDVEVDNFIVKTLDATIGDYYVYEENFDSYVTFPENWKVANAGNDISYVALTAAGKMNIIEPKGNWLITYLDKEIGADNYEFSAKVTLNEYEKGVNTRYFGLVFNYKDKNNFAEASFRINGQGSMGIMRLNGTSLDDSTSFDLTTAGITPATGVTYALKVRVENQIATFYVNEIEMGSYNLNGNLANAYNVGFITSGVTIDVDDVIVSKLVVEPYYDMYQDWANANSSYTTEWSSNVSGAITYSNGKMVAIDSKTNTYINPHINIKDANGKYLGYNAETGTNDYEVETKITPSSYTTASGAWNPYWGLALRYQDPTHYIELCVGKTGGMYIEMSNAASGATGKLKIDNFTHGRTYTLKARCVGQELTVYVDDVEVAKATIPTSLNTGTVGFTARNYNYTVDNFKVTSVDGSNTVLYNTGFGDVISDDWTMTGLSNNNKVVANADGSIDFDINELAYVRCYLNRDFGYNEETQTSDYIIEAEYTIEDYLVVGTNNPNIGFYFRQGPDLDNDGDYAEHKDYVYAAIRTNTGYGWIQGNNTSGSGLYNDPGQAANTVALNKGSTYILKATVVGDNMDFTVTEKSTGKVVLHVYVTNPLDGKFDTGMVGFGNYGVKGTLESFFIKRIVEEGKTPAELGLKLVPEKMLTDNFSQTATLPAEWHDEVAARRYDSIAYLEIGTNAKNSTNGALIAEAIGNAHNVIALDREVTGDNFVYEVDLTMLFADNKDHPKMGPVFGLQDDSVSVGANTSFITGTVIVEAWLINANNVHNNGSQWKGFGSGTIGTPEVGRTYRFKVVGDGNYVTVYVDGAKIVECKIDDAFVGGRFGFMLRNSVVSIDNVKLHRTVPKYEIAKTEAITGTAIRVATFNIGDFSTASGTAAYDHDGDGKIDHGNTLYYGNGTEVTKAEYRAVFEAVDADIWGLQEDSNTFNWETKETPYNAIYSAVHTNYERKFTGSYNGKAFLTSYVINDAERVDYNPAKTSYAPDGTTDYGHAWFLTSSVLVDDKEIYMATLHFDWACKERRAQQIADVLAWAADKEYCIILGDFNPENCINGANAPKNDKDYVNGTGYINMYQIDWKYFTDAGFVSANGEGEFGPFQTLVANGKPRGGYPWDNIFVSPNIKIVNAEPVYMSWMSDHAIVVADLIIE